MRTPIKLAFGLLTAIVMLGSLELILRAVAGSPTPELAATLPGGTGELLRSTDRGVEPMYQQTRRQGEVSRARGENGRRVIWVGGSSIHGGTQGITRAEEAPGRLASLLDVESLNFGGIGMDTVSIGAIIEDLMELNPDVLVVYTGHNELGNAVFTGRYGDEATARIAVWRARLGSVRLYQALESVIRGREVLRLPSAATEGQFAVTDRVRSEIYWRFRERLRYIVNVAAMSGVPTVLATLMSNPAAPSIEWQCPEAIKRAGITSVRPEALAVDALKPSDLSAAEALAPACRDLAWVQARRNGDRAALDKLRDSDPLPVRADRQINAVIRGVARETGATLVEVDGFARVAGGGIEPCAWFLDPMHLTVEGHDALARMVAQGVAPLLAMKPPAMPPPPAEAKDRAGCCSEGCRDRMDF